MNRTALPLALLAGAAIAFAAPANAGKGATVSSPIELAKVLIVQPLTMSLRLFANMFAGHLLLLVFILGGEYMLLHGSGPSPVLSIAAFGMGIVMTFFELLVQLLQAYVFALLTALYLAASLSEEH